MSGVRTGWATYAGFGTRTIEVDGTGPRFVLLHGFADSANTWDGGRLFTAQKFVPRSMIERISTSIGGHSALLDDVDQATRSAYEDRARRS